MEGWVNYFRIGKAKKIMKGLDEMTRMRIRMAHSPVMQTTVTNDQLQKLGYVGFSNHYYWKTRHQGKLF